MNKQRGQIYFLGRLRLWINKSVPFSSRLESGGDIVIDSDGRVVFEAVKDLDQESHEKSKNGALWTSMEGEGWTDETVLQSQLIAKGELMIRAAEGLQIDLKEIDQHTVSQTIDVMVQADPDLAWLKEMDERGDIDWRLVKEVHDQWDYEHSGLGGVAALIIAIIVTYLTAGAASGVVSQALISSVASNAAISTINNGGNMGAVFKDITSSDALKGYAVSAVTAGIGSQFSAPVDVGWSRAGAKTVAGKVILEAGVKQVAYGGSFKDTLLDSLISNAVSIVGAKGASAIGDMPDLQNGSLSKVVLHAALGGLMAEAMGGDFRSGAIAGGANELLTDWLGEKLMPDESRKDDPDYKLEYQEASRRLLLASQLAGVLAAAATDSDPNIGMAVAANATQNNFLRHTEVEALKKELDRCGDNSGCAKEVEARYWQVVKKNQEALAACQENGNCSELYAEIQAGEQAMQKLGMWKLDDKEGFAYNQQGDRLKAGELKLIEETGKSLEKQKQDRIKEEERQKQYDKELLEFAQDEGRWNDLRRQEALQAETTSIQQDLGRLQKEIAEADLSADETARVIAEIQKDRQTLVGGAQTIATGGALIADLLEPDALDLLGPAVKAAKLVELAATLKKMGSSAALQLSAKLEEAAKLTKRMDDLNAGKVSDAALAKHYGGLPSELALKRAQAQANTPLPNGYRELGSASAASNVTEGLPDGYRRVSSKTGNTEVLGSDGKIYLEMSSGLVEKRPGGNLAHLREVEQGILGPKTAVASTGPKVPPKLQAFTNPPQGPVIPSGWISRPGRAPGSTIYYPPGTDPSAPGSTYIRLMPSGSTPVPGLENGYWISVKNGQPINPATGGTGTRGDTHVPLPPNTVPPKR